MRVGIFGGSFDPPHRGHLAVAEAARDKYALDRVLLAPAGKQPLKAAGSTATYEQRLAMTSLLCNLDSSGVLQASDVDAPRADGQPNYTVDTLQRLHAELSDFDELYVIAGADSFLDLPLWREPERLLALAEWIVVSRPGLDETGIDRLQFTWQQRARVHWLGGVADPVSATDVRARLAAGLSCKNLVPRPVMTYIKDQVIYIPAGRIWQNKIWVAVLSFCFLTLVAVGVFGIWAEWSSPASWQDRVAGVLWLLVIPWAVYRILQHRLRRLRVSVARKIAQRSAALR